MVDTPHTLPITLSITLRPLPPQPQEVKGVLAGPPLAEAGAAASRARLDGQDNRLGRALIRTCIVCFCFHFCFHRVEQALVFSQSLQRHGFAINHGGADEGTGQHLIIPRSVQGDTAGRPGGKCLVCS